MRVRIYVDGLNFYYGIAKPLSFKWLDVRALLGKIIGAKFANNNIDITNIKLFTAKVIGDNTAKKQAIYIEALEATGIEVIQGSFKEHRKNLQLLESDKPIDKAKATPQFVPVIAPEEKQTDVNLACSMVQIVY